MIGRNTPLPDAPDAVILQWANGKPVARPAGTSERFLSLVGFHIEVGKDDQLDAALASVPYLQIEIRHQRPGGAEIVRHWSLGAEIEILLVTSGPVASSVAASLSNGNARRTADAGIGLHWPAGEGERSRMALRGFVRQLWQAGYRRPVQLAVKSRMSDVLLSVLLDHTRAAVEVDTLIDRGRHPEEVSPAELWLPLGPGEETEFGRGDTATVVPFASRHPAALTVDYLRTIWRDAAVWAAAVEAWPLVKAWAATFAAGGEPALLDEAPPAEPAEAPPAGMLLDAATRPQTADEAMASGAGRRRGR